MPLKRVLWFAGTVGLLLFVLLNASAYRHAYRMTHFVKEGRRTGSPESMSRVAKLWTLVSGVTIPKLPLSRTPSAEGLSYEEVRFSASDGVALAGWLIPADGAEGIVVGFHGYSANKEQFLPEARLYHELGWDVLLVDQRASGDSGGWVSTLGYYEAQDVLAAVAWVGVNRPVGRIVLLGKSMGSVAILRALSMGGARAWGAVLECPFNRFVTTVRHRFRAMGVPSFPCADLLVLWGGVQNGFNAFRFNPVSYARAVTCPVLLLHGGRDPRVSVADIEEVRDALAGPTSLHVFEGRGHESYYAWEPDVYRTLVRRWLASDEHGTDGPTSP